MFYKCKKYQGQSGKCECLLVVDIKIKITFATAGASGVCGYPAKINIPFFIALSRVLSCSFELYGAHFLWIADLSAKDPYYILGALTGLSMLLTPAVDPKQTAMRYASALIFGTVTMYLSSGLALFIFMNTVLNLLQGFVTRRFKSFASNKL